jgi:hypothetical protein
VQHLGHPKNRLLQFSEWIPPPNYSLSVQEVFTSLATAYLQRCEVNILHQTGISSQYISNWPTWVPDWTAPCNPQRISSDKRALGHTRGNCRIRLISKGAVLIIIRFLFDVISHIFGFAGVELKRKSTKYWEIRKNIERDFAVIASIYKTYFTGEMLVKAYWQTLTGSCYYEDPSGPPRVLISSRLTLQREIKESMRMLLNVITV